MKISIKLVYRYMTIFFNFLPTSNHLHLLQVENYGSNSRLVVDEDDNGKFRPERVKHGVIHNMFHILVDRLVCDLFIFAFEKIDPPP